MKVTLGSPMLVAERKGHFWFPCLTPLPTGEIVLGCSASPDVHGAPPIGSYAISADKGRSWSDLTLMPYGMLHAYFPKGDDLVLLPFRWSHGNTERTALVGPRVTLSNHGRRYCVDLLAIRVEGLPRPVGELVPGEASFVTAANIVPLPGGRLFSMLYGAFPGDKEKHMAARNGRQPGRNAHGMSLLAMESRDGGACWQVVSTVADWSFNPDYAEGPDETAIVELADKSLLAVFRVGIRKDHPLHKCISRDEGRTWSAPEPMPAHGVMPSLVRVASGGLVLASGRPGIQLWYNPDGRGAQWESIDIIEHHNRVVTKPEYRIEPLSVPTHFPFFHTTSYTKLLEVAPNKLLFCYDRVPNDWNPVPDSSTDQNRIFVLPIEIAGTSL